MFVILVAIRSAKIIRHPFPRRRLVRSLCMFRHDSLHIPVNADADGGSVVGNDFCKSLVAVVVSLEADPTSVATNRSLHGVKRAKRESDHSCSSNAGVMNTESCIFTSFIGLNSLIFN